LAANQLKWQLSYLLQERHFPTPLPYTEKQQFVETEKANFSGFFISTAKI